MLNSNKLSLFRTENSDSSGFADITISDNIGSIDNRLQRNLIENPIRIDETPVIYQQGIIWSIDSNNNEVFASL